MKASVEFFEVGNRALLFGFEVEDSRIVINFLCLSNFDCADRALDLYVLLVVSDDQIVDNVACVVGMDMA